MVKVVLGRMRAEEGHDPALVTIQVDAAIMAAEQEGKRSVLKLLKDFKDGKDMGESSEDKGKASGEEEGRKAAVPQSEEAAAAAPKNRAERRREKKTQDKARKKEAAVLRKLGVA